MDAHGGSGCLLMVWGDGVAHGRDISLTALQTRHAGDVGCSVVYVMIDKVVVGDALESRRS